MQLLHHAPSLHCVEAQSHGIRLLPEQLENAAGQKNEADHAYGRGDPVLLLQVRHPLFTRSHPRKHPIGKNPGETKKHAPTHWIAFSGASAFWKYDDEFIRII
jgi:hypothetical protein